MVNLPLRRNFAPISNNADSVLHIMEEMRGQQKTLSSILGGINNVGSVQSDNLVDTTNTINNIISNTDEVTKKLANQQQAINSIQTSNIAPEKLIKGLNNELSQLRTASSQISNQASKLNNIISKGFSVDAIPEDITKNISSTVESFSSNAGNLISGLNQNQELLSQFISTGKNEISGIIDGTLPDINIDDIFSNFNDLSLGDEISTVEREADQVFGQVSDEMNSVIDDLKATITNPIAAKVSSLGDFSKITNDIKGTIDQAKAGLNNLKSPISQLGDVSNMIDDVKGKMTESLGKISTQATKSFTDQFEQISNISSSLTNVGQQVKSNIDSLSSTIDSSLADIGGPDINTGLPSGISSLTNISLPADSLSTSISDMNNLGHELMVTSSSLSTFAGDYLGDNPIKEISNKLISIGQQIYDQTTETPGALKSLVTVTDDPGLNVGSIEKAIFKSGNALTMNEIPNIKLNINSDKMSKDLVNQILIINDSINSAQ